MTPPTLRRAEHAENEIKATWMLRRNVRRGPPQKKIPRSEPWDVFRRVKVSTFGQRRSRDALMSAFFSESALNC